MHLIILYSFGFSTRYLKKHSLLYFTEYKIGKTIGMSIGHKKKSKRTIIHHRSIEVQRRYLILLKKMPNFILYKVNYVAFLLVFLHFY